MEADSDSGVMDDQFFFSLERISGQQHKRDTSLGVTTACVRTLNSVFEN